MSEPREFWIRVPSGGIGHDTITNVAIESQWENEVHVIEYAAYLELQAKLAAYEHETETVKELKKESARLLRIAMTHAEEYHDGCLMCGVPLSQKYDKDGKELESHKASCWWEQCESFVNKLENGPKGWAEMHFSDVRLNNKLREENAKLLTAGRGLVETLKKLDEEVDPRGGDFDPGFITQKGINLIDKALTQFGKVFPDGDHQRNATK